MRLTFTSALLCSVALASQPNPPSWDTSRVLIFDPLDTDCQTRVDAIFTEMGGDDPDCNNGQFSDSRYALMFKPGYHDCSVNVGYYTQVLGLGYLPTDNVLAELHSPDSCSSALCNFWRGVENMEFGASQDSVDYHVSQAAPLRRVVIDGDLKLGVGNSSGGFMSNSQVYGKIYAGSQQQFFYRNVQMDDGFQKGAWTFVFVGCSGDVPETDCGGTETGTPATTIATTPIIAEKPFITLNDDETTYTLNIPKYDTNTSGIQWNFSEHVDFSQVYVASDSDSAATINSYLAQGLHVVLQPGNYYLEEALLVGQIEDGPQVLLGLGLATLISQNGNSCVTVVDGSDARLAGFLLQASETYSDNLLQWGTDPSQGNSTAPGVISDVFARVGGPNNSTETNVTTGTMMEINNQGVIIDNTWLWRADHDVAGTVYNSSNPVDSCLTVNADNVTTYGLMAEHTLGNMVNWYGNNGQVYFFQSELAHDVTQENFGNCTGFYVDESAENFKGYGIAVYVNFRDYLVWIDSAITAPEASYFENSYMHFLNNYGGVYHVVNDQGDGVNADNKTSWLCTYDNSTESVFIQ